MEVSEEKFLSENFLLSHSIFLQLGVENKAKGQTVDEQ